jgi:hypothetical protein
MAAANEPPMTSPSSSNSTGQEPQLPPLLPPLRSTQHILQPLSVFPVTVVSGLGEEVTYDYVFGGPRSAVSYSTLKLTSPPVRLRPDGKFYAQQRLSGSLDDGRTPSSHSHFHYQQPRRSPGNSLKRKQCLFNGGGSRTSLKSNDDEDTLRQLLNE